MGVTVREKPSGSGVWWVFISHQGRRKSKRIGQEDTARKVAEQIQAKLTLGELGIKSQVEKPVIPTYKQCAQKWLNQIFLTRRKSTYTSYRSNMNLHILPKFGSLPIDSIKRSQIREFLLEHSTKGDRRGAFELPKNGKPRGVRLTARELSPCRRTA